MRLEEAVEAGIIEEMKPKIGDTVKVEMYYADEKTKKIFQVIEEFPVVTHKTFEMITFHWLTELFSKRFEKPHKFISTFLVHDGWVMTILDTESIEYRKVGVAISVIEAKNDGEGEIT